MDFTQCIPMKQGFDIEQRKGWVCPRCGRCYAPYIAECSYCNADTGDRMRSTETSVQRWSLVFGSQNVESNPDEPQPDEPQIKVQRDRVIAMINEDEQRLRGIMRELHDKGS